MAKVSFTKLGLNKDQETKIVEFNGQNIEVKQYLSVNDKLEMISNAVNQANDQNNFENPIKLNVFLTLEILYNYTNINFTEKLKEDPVKLYDLITANNFTRVIFDAIPDAEMNEIITGLKETAKAYYVYKNSAYGIMEAISQDYSALDLDATKIQKEIADPNNLGLLKTIVTKLG